MAWVSIEQDHDYRSGLTITAYKAGWSGSVTQACADEVIGLGKGVKIKAPRKGETPDPEPIGAEDGKATASG